MENIKKALLEVSFALDHAIINNQPTKHLEAAREALLSEIVNEQETELS